MATDSPSKPRSSGRHGAYAGKPRRTTATRYATSVAAIAESTTVEPRPISTKTNEGNVASRRHRAFRIHVSNATMGTIIIANEATASYGSTSHGAWGRTDCSWVLTPVRSPK